MNIGDLVIVKKPPFISGEEEGRMREGEHGIILDILEMTTGDLEMEVLFENGVDWFNSLELEMCSDTKK